MSMLVESNRMTGNLGSILIKKGLEELVLFFCGEKKMGGRLELAMGIKYRQGYYRGWWYRSLHVQKGRTKSNGFKFP